MVWHREWSMVWHREWSMVWEGGWDGWVGDRRRVVVDWVCGK